MNEKTWAILFFIVFGLLLVCTGIAAGLGIRGSRYKRELEAARLELECARSDALALAERQRAIDGNLERARSIVERQQASIRSAAGTVQDIRDRIAEIRAYTDMLEDCLRNNGGGNGSSDCDTGSDTSE